MKIKINWFDCFLLIVLCVDCFLIGMNVEKNKVQNKINDIAKQYNELYEEYENYKEHSWRLMYY